MVYVQDINGKPMMPTTRHGKVRRLLKDKKAVVVNLCPFTIKLTYVTSDYKQEIVLGVDAGTKHVGLSATTKSKELYSSEVILRNDIVDLLSTRRELRRTRRNRLRYRKPRFDNRIKSKRPGWVAPSVKYKIDAHIRVMGFIIKKSIIYNMMDGNQLEYEFDNINLDHITFKGNVDILPSLKRMGFLDTNARNPDITIAGITLALQFGNALPKYITGCKNITVVNCSARRAHPRAVA